MKNNEDIKTNQSSESKQTSIDKTVFVLLRTGFEGVGKNVVFSGDYRSSMQRF